MDLRLHRHSFISQPSGCHLKSSSIIRQFPVKSMNQRRLSRNFGVKACFINPTQEPFLKEAFKVAYLLSSAPKLVELKLAAVFLIPAEPIAFMGGMFAGLLRLDLSEDPLKEWVTRTVKASGITEEIVTEEGTQPEGESPRQIEIE